MDFQPEEFNEILNIFRNETDEIVQKLNNNLLQLETDPENKDLLVYLFRDAHSLKGAARMIGFNNIQRLAHKTEDVLGLAKENKIIINHEIIDALYKALDLMSELIQTSVKIKKEYYTDNIQKQIDNIDKALNNQAKLELENSTNNQQIKPAKNILYTENKIYSKTQQKKDLDIEKKATTINALISESYLLLQNMQGQEGSAYIETFKDTIKNLREIFEEFENYDLKNEVKNIEFKVDFVLQSSNLMNIEEIDEINNKISKIIDLLNAYYSQNNIEKFDLQKIIQKKSDKAKSSISDETSQNTTNDQNSIIKIFAEKIDYIKAEIHKLEIDLTTIPNIIETANFIKSITNKKEIAKISNKVCEVLDIIKNSQNLPEKETINILKQCFSTVEKIAFVDKEEKEDVSLVLQRLDIVKQMIDINTSINPLTTLSATLNDTSLPIKKAQDFFNSFETTSIRTLRVESKKLDELVSQIGELIISRIKHKKNNSELESLITELNEWKTFNNKSQNFIKYYDRKHLNNTEIDYKTLSIFSKQIYSILQENSAKIIKLSQKINNLQKSVDEEDSKLNLVINRLETMIKNIRVLPLATIFHMFPRMIRDIANDTGKEIELLISGSETSADKKVIEEIKAPLMHIIRNSIDHGIETPEERIAAGKSPKGKIYLVAKNSQNKIIIEVHDDGRGIDLQKIINRALEKNMITQREAAHLSAEQIMNIIFWPGFSTEKVVTEISGRGVGLDIVQTKISQLNGSVKVFSVPNQGTKITIELPITMSTLKAFIVKSQKQIFALPMTAVNTIMWINNSDIYERNGIQSIIINDKTVNLFYLNDLMNLPQNPDTANSNKKTVMLIEVENSLLGIIVDKILGDQDILQKKLEPPIMKLKNISGITTLANGETCLILNLLELYKNTYIPVEKPLITNKKYHLKTKLNKDYRILIVDDSLTTRELLKTILANNGYSFDMVKNPREAFEYLIKKNYDIILSDMEMPEMDGRMFAKELKNNPRFKDIPIIMITSYEAKKLAKDMPDINAFIKKSNFNQDFLLETIEKLIKNE